MLRKNRNWEGWLLVSGERCPNRLLVKVGNIANDRVDHQPKIWIVQQRFVDWRMAGHETTSNALTWTWYLLSQHPGVVSKLHAELDEVLAGRTPTLADLRQLPYTAQVVKEAMRLYPPAWVLNTRQANAHVEIDGYALPTGTKVFIAPYVMHRLPQYFEDPDQFRPERFTPEFEEQLPRFAYMPFGGGPRVCIGNSFAMMEAQLVLATIAQRYTLHLAPEAKVATEPMITLTAKHGMLMRVEERIGEQPLRTAKVGAPSHADLFAMA